MRFLSVVRRETGISSRRPLDPDWTPAVTILKPVCGTDPEAYENFASFCRLDYPADKVQIVFGALDAADPALERSPANCKPISPPPILRLSRPPNRRRATTSKSAI